MLKRLTTISPLGWRLVAATVAFSTLVAFMATAIQLYFDYRRDLGQIEATFDQVGLSYLPTISNALWATNRQDLQIAINGLARLRYVQYVAAKENSKLMAEAGHPKAQNIRSREYPLTQLHRGQTLNIGSLTVVMDMAGVYQRLLEQFWVILISNSVKTIFVGGFMLGVFYWLVTRHLRRIAEFASRLSSDNLDERLALCRPVRANAKPDEFDLLLEGFSRMQSNLTASLNALRESELYRRALVESSPIGLALSRMDGALVDVNPAYAKIIGRSVEETRHLTYWQITPEKYAEQEKRQLDLLATVGSFGPYEKEYIRSDGQLVPVRLSGLILERAGERFIWSSVEDITERIAVQEKAQALLERLTLATDATNIGIWEWGILSDAWYASPTYFTMLGYEPEECLPGRDVWLERLHPDDRDAVADKIRAVLGGSDAPYQYEARMRHADGSYRWISVSGRVVEWDEHGKPSRLLGSRMDITERKQAENELRHNEERVQTILRATSDVIWDWDLLQATLWWNENFMQQFGYQAQDIEPGIESWINRIHPDDQERVKTSIHAVIDDGGQFWKDEYQFRRHDGSYAYIFDRGYVIHDDEGKPVRMVGAMVDLSERKVMEDQLRRQLEELMCWQDVMLGREDRVQELKKEINELLIRLGLPIRYPSQSAS